MILKGSFVSLCLHPNKAGSLGGYHRSHGSRQLHTFTHSSFSLFISFFFFLFSLQLSRAAGLPEYQPVIKKFIVLTFSQDSFLWSNSEAWWTLIVAFYFTVVMICCLRRSREREKERLVMYLTISVMSRRLFSFHVS